MMIIDLATISWLLLLLTWIDDVAMIGSSEVNRQRATAANTEEDDRTLLATLRRMLHLYNTSIFSDFNQGDNLLLGNLGEVIDIRRDLKRRILGFIHVESCSNKLDGSDYRSYLNETRSGKPCRNWNDVQNRYHPSKMPSEGLVDNYCRNPSRHQGGPWCYTSIEPSKWDHCDVKPCNDELGFVYIKCDANWEAHNGNGCWAYGEYKWCKKNYGSWGAFIPGIADHYGPDWNKKWGKIEDWRDNEGRTAYVCPECGCSKGVMHEGGVRFKCDATWTASNGKGCDKYSDPRLQYCKKDGDHYGEGWNKPKWGTFQKWSDEMGRSALVCPQCGCDGGVTLKGEIYLACDETWKAVNGAGCKKYRDRRLCKMDGDHYGEGWSKSKWGTFNDWRDEKGRSALVCPQCGCKGGVITKAKWVKRGFQYVSTGSQDEHRKEISVTSRECVPRNRRCQSEKPCCDVLYMGASCWGCYERNLGWCDGGNCVIDHRTRNKIAIDYSWKSPGMGEPWKPRTARAVELH